MQVLVRILIVVVGYLTASGAHAQPFTDIASLNYHYHLPTQYREAQDAEKRDLRIASADLILPLHLGKGNYFLIGGQHQDVNFGVHDQNRVNQNFKVTEGRLGALLQWNERHKTLFLILPKWSGLEEYFRSAHFQMGGVLLHTRKLSSSLSLKAGLYYNREFFGHFFIPLVGIDWKINENLWLYGNLPGNLQLHKVLSPSLAISASFLSPSGSFYLNRDGDYIRNGESFPPYAILSADAHWEIVKPVTLKVSLGHSIWRHYGQYDATKKQINSGDYADYKDGVILSGSLIARIFEIDRQ